MTKTKLAFVRCRLSCFSRRPVRFFPRLFPFACLLLFACRRFRCPALGLAGFFPRRIFRYRLSVFFLVFSFPPSGSLFSPSFPFCLSVVVRLSSFSLSGIGTCRLFPAADFSLSSFCFFSRLFLPAVRFAFFPVFSLLPVCCCSPVVVFAVRHWDLPAFSRGGFFAIVFLFFFSSFPSRRPVCFFPRLFPFAGISLPCLSFPSSLFVSGLSFLLFSSLFSPFCFFFFTGKRQAVVRPADMAAVWR